MEPAEAANPPPTSAQSVTQLPIIPAETAPATDAGIIASADPDVGLRAVRSLHLLADRLEALHVAHARELGWSWQDIADRLGISRQAAHKKYGSSLSRRP